MVGNHGFVHPPIVLLGYSLVLHLEWRRSQLAGHLLGEWGWARSCHSSTPLLYSQCSRDTQRASEQVKETDLLWVEMK